MSLPKKKFDYSFISRVLAITIVFCCSVSFLKLLVESDFDFQAIFLDSNYRFGIVEEDATSYVLNYNANELGFMCNMGITGLLLRIYNSSKSRTLDVALIAFMVLFGTLTQSRAFVLCLMLVFIFYVLSIAQKNVKAIKIVIGAIVIIAATVAVINFIAPYIIESVVDRFNEEDITGGRSRLFAWYNNYIFSEPSHFLFGTGQQDLLEKVNKYGLTITKGVPHNGTQELVVTWGFWGVILFGFLLVDMCLFSKQGKKKPIFYFPLILWVIMVQSLQIMRSGMNLLMLAFVFVSMLLEFENNPNKDL